MLIALCAPLLLGGCGAVLSQVKPPEPVDTASALSTVTTSPAPTTPPVKLRCGTVPLADVVAVGGFTAAPKLTEAMGGVSGCAWTDGLRRVQIQDQPASAWFANSKGLDGAVDRLGEGTSAAEKHDIAAAQAEVSAGRTISDDRACSIFATLNRAMGSDLPVAQLTGLPTPARPTATPPAAGATTSGGPRTTPAPASGAKPSAQALPMVVALPNATKPLAVLAQQCRNGRFTSVLVAGPAMKVTTVMQQRQVRFLTTLAAAPLG